MIVAGVVVALLDRRHRLQSLGVRAEEYGLADAIKGMAALAEALRDYDLGRFLVVLGTVLLLVGATVGGVSGL